MKKEIVDKWSFTAQLLSPVALKQEQWAIVYESSDYDEANLLLELFMIASEKLGVLIEMPLWIEIGFSGKKDFKSIIQEYENAINYETKTNNLKAIIVCLPKA